MDDRFSWKKGDLEMTTPQCKSCKYYGGPMECKLNINVTGKILLNKEECKSYKQK